jgi:hypothetical protein
MNLLPLPQDIDRFEVNRFEAGSLSFHWGFFTKSVSYLCLGIDPASAEPAESEMIT